jgi:hypothetical protein
MVRAERGHGGVGVEQMTPKVLEHGLMLDDRAGRERAPVRAGCLAALPIGVGEGGIGEPKGVDGCHDRIYILNPAFPAPYRLFEADIAFRLAGWSQVDRCSPPCGSGEKATTMLMRDADCA